jgi:hypothetical protein
MSARYFRFKGKIHSQPTTYSEINTEKMKNLNEALEKASAIISELAVSGCDIDLIVIEKQKN